MKFNVYIHKHSQYSVEAESYEEAVEMANKVGFEERDDVEFYGEDTDIEIEDY